MSVVDSEVVFTARCKEIGLDDATVIALGGKGWKTFGSFAFSVSTNPGVVADADFDAKVSVPVLGSANHADAAKLRRLLFESYTLTASELKRRAEHSESDAPKKLPVQEIAARFTALEKKLAPLKIESVLEPSHSLINSVAQCLEDGRLRYTEWSKCTSRTSEIKNLKENANLKVWKADASGNIKQSEAEANLKCDVSSELDVFNALRRRGVAYELANLMSFEKRETIINLLFTELQRESLDGFKKVSLSQLALADREIHVKLAEATRAGLPIGPSGDLPLDTHVKDVLSLPAVMWLLMPKQKGGASDKADKPPAPAHPRAREQDKRKVSNSHTAQSKGKKIKKIPMPLKLRGGVPVDSEGRSLCYGYNLGTCHDKNCKRGRHVCCYPGCFAANHTFLTHAKGGA